MKIVQNLHEIQNESGQAPDVGLTIGNFDGVHLGHRELLSAIKSNCKAHGLKFVVVTFIPHPQKILQPEKERFLINSYEKRRMLLEELGVDYLVEMKFTRDFSTLSPAEFISRHLLCYASLRHIYLGYDFAFGANKQGGFDLVRDLCSPKSINVDVQPVFHQGSEVVSSTSIREFLMSGEVERANNFLQRPFDLEGIVIKGEGRGKKIGYPTANVQVNQDLIIPQKGVYVTRTIYKGMTYNSVTNIGHNPTFKDSDQLHIETNLFDFDNDIYGETLYIQFLKKLRNEKKFATVNDLISQIRADVETAKNFLEKR